MTEPAPTGKAEHGWCINCLKPFAPTAVRWWFGAGRQQVGPFCETCDRVIKAHARGLGASD